MNYWNELTEMRANYAKKPMQQIRLPRPVWLTDRDRLSVLYREVDRLVREGDVYYAQIVQANEYLFRFFPQVDCPANLVYSAEDCVCQSPACLRDFAGKLYSYKYKRKEEIPENWRELVKAISNEYSRASFDFMLCSDVGTEQPFHAYITSNMIFRKYLPHRKLCGSLLPILAIPGQCESVLVLPKQYWTKTFLEEWVNGTI